VNDFLEEEATMKFALLYYFYDRAQAGPASRARSATELALDAQINEAGAHVYEAGFHPQRAPLLGR
jgi:hypothetical protein